MTSQFIVTLGVIFLISSCKEQVKIPEEETQKTTTGQRTKSTRQNRNHYSSDDHRKEAFLKEHETIARFSNEGPNEVAAHVSQMLAEDEERTLRILRHLELEVNYDAIGYALFQHFSQANRMEDGMAAFEIIGDNPTLASPLLETFAARYWDETPEKASQWLIDHPECQGIHSALHLVGIKLGGSENRIKGIQKVLSSNLAENLQANFLSGAIKEWFHSDLEGAFTYMSELPSSSLKDQSIYDMVQHAAPLNLESAMAWAETIENEGLRISAIQQVSQKWQEDDPDGFSKWEQKK